MKIKINCLGCGFPMELGDTYEDYQGEIRCWGCQAVLEVAIQDGKLMRMRRHGDAGTAILIETR